MRAQMVAGMTGVAVLAVVIQLVPGHAGVNPLVDARHTIEANLSVPAPVEAVFNKACRNCHSNETQWPWYSRIAPVSWMIQHDVDKARHAMNLSTWQVQNGRTRGTAIGTLMAACTGLEAGRMPPAPYRLMHPDAKLTAEEVRGFCAWTATEARELRAQSRR